MSPVKGRVLSEFTHALNFKISVDVQCSHTRPTNDFYNILRVGRSGDYGNFGDRIFMINHDIHRRGVLNLAYNTNNDDRQERVQRECNDGEWNTYSLTQRQIENNSSFVRLSLEEDGLEIGSHEMETSIANKATNMELKVYLADPWHVFAATTFNVRNFFLEQYDETTATTTLPPGTFVGSELMQPIQNKIIREFTPALNFQLSIDIQCSHDHPAGKFYNIFHVTKGSHFGSFGDRLFAIWQHKNARGLLHINTSKDSGVATQIDSACNDGEWNTYSLRHRQIWNNPSRVKLSLTKDGNEIKSTEMDTLRANQITNMGLKVYLSHPWSAPATAYNVKNFYVEEYDRLD